jgi:antitoxin (DNA-binding transcriptional repressor) of toxin-antitoxin stability system
MSTTVSALEARRNFGMLLNRVFLNNEEIIIERAGKRIARLMSCSGKKEINLHKGKLDFRKSRGLGGDIWKTLDADEYVRKERSEWN